MILKKKRFLTLIEVMIAMGLAMGILTALTAIHWQMVTLGVKAEREYAEMFQHLLLQNRLSNTLAHIDNKKIFYLSEDPIYPGLVFSPTRGNDLSKTFSNDVITRVFCTKNQLFLATLPSLDKWNEQQPPILVELLADNVTDFKVQFVDSEGQNLNSWDKDIQALPAIVIFSMNIKKNRYEQKIVIPKHEKVLSL
jgi:type II secretory pathway pseudopilin PulG